MNDISRIKCIAYCCLRRLAYINSNYFLFNHLIQAYFKEKSFDLNEKDQKGSAPIHWACYLGLVFFEI